MKSYSILLVFFLFMCGACMEDESEYKVQEKEDVTVEGNQPDGSGGANDSLSLKPGLNKVFLSLPGERTEIRAFKYYFPMSLKVDKPISLVFDFHGSYTFEEGTEVPDPLMGLSTSNILCRIADTANIIVVFPAGTVPVFNGKPANSVNWQVHEEHLPFFDAMVEFFKGRTPQVDINRIYSCGQSSGAIFSFGLAMERSGVVAAVAPVSGQYALGADFVKPERVVPIRAFNGVNDDIVNYNAAVGNITTWAEKVADYYAGASTTKALTINEYKINTKQWNGGSGDIELYGIDGEGHGVDWTKIGVTMWEFMRAHPLNATPELSLAMEKNNLVVEKGQALRVAYRLTPGASMDITAPAGWVVTRESDSIRVEAPQVNNVDAVTTGKVTFKISNTAGKERSYSLDVKAIVTYKLGDIYYTYSTSGASPVGVVYELSDDKQTGKMVAFEDWTLAWGTDTLLSGLTMNDGSVNTKKIGEQLPLLTVDGCAAKKCAAAGTGWYLPSRDELEKLNEVLDVLQTGLGGKMLQDGKHYWTSSQKSKTEAYAVIIGEGYTGGYGKTLPALVRAVKKF